MSYFVLVIINIIPIYREGDLSTVLKSSHHHLVHRQSWKLKKSDSEYSQSTAVAIPLSLYPTETLPRRLTSVLLCDPSNHGRSSLKKRPYQPQHWSQGAGSRPGRKRLAPASRNSLLAVTLRVLCYHTETHPETLNAFPSLRSTMRLQIIRRQASDP